MKKTTLTPWLNNHYQFPRLLAEIYSVGLTKKQYAQLQESMDLQQKDIDELLERAMYEFEEIKEEVFHGLS